MQELEHGAAFLAAPGDRWRRAWTTALLDLLFPPFCPVCGRRLGEGRRDPLCGVCWERLERIEGPCCRICGSPWLAAMGEREAVSPDSFLCGRCRRHPPPFSYARSAAFYGATVREALHAFKFRGRRALAAPLGDLLAGVGPCGLSGNADFLVPVPLHPSRERERGFNQALLLARRVGRAWGLPVRTDVLIRAIATPPQTELTAQERRRNVRGAFALRRPDPVAGRHIIVVDDILTSGSTVGACARCLVEAGASSVGVLTVARVI